MTFKDVELKRILESRMQSVCPSTTWDSEGYADMTLTGTPLNFFTYQIQVININEDLINLQDKPNQLV